MLGPVSRDETDVAEFIPIESGLHPVARDFTSFNWRFVRCAAACEGDLNTLLTMMLFSFTSGEPLIMGNIYLFRPEFGRRFPPPQGVIVEDTKMYLKDNKARLIHDVIPLSLATSKYKLEDFHNTGRGATAYATLRSDEVATFGRIDPRLDRVVFTVAKIERVEDSVICCFSAWLKMKNTEEYIRNISSIHSAMVYGDLKWLQPQLAPKQKLLTYFFHVSLEKNIKRAEAQRNWFQLSGDAPIFLDMTKEIW